MCRLQDRHGPAHPRRGCRPDPGRVVGQQRTTDNGPRTMLFFWLITLFLLGACVGSFLNVCIYRMPLEKSVLWPGSRCGHCLQAIRWYDNLPLVSYLVLRGRCRECGVKFSMRYFWVEVLTGLCLAGIFYLDVYENVPH